MRRKLSHPKLLLTLSMLLVLFWVAAPSSAQTTTVTPMTPSGENPTAQNSTVMPNDGDTTRRQIAAFDNFLDSHPEIAGQLRQDPSLVNNQEYVEDHPALQEYLQQHPEIREEIKENPNAFMRREDRYDRHEEESRDRDTTRGELAGMDRFLDSHPEIAEQLRKDPSLINNREFMEHHPALQEFLSQHPEIREEFRENPNAFMHREERFDRREEDRDTTRGELASMDRFLDGHPEIAEQLRKDPSLVNNEKFVKTHPALEDYLQQHSEVRQEIAENPRAFMRQEQRYDRREDASLRDRDMASFHEFLDSHSTIASQLSRDPQLAKNEEYAANHPELQEYLKAHPGVRERLAENPQLFMKTAQQFSDNSTTAPKGMATQPPTTKPPSVNPKPPSVEPKPNQQ